MAERLKGGTAKPSRPPWIRYRGVQRGLGKWSLMASAWQVLRRLKILCCACLIMIGWKPKKVERPCFHHIHSEFYYQQRLKGASNHTSFAALPFHFARFNIRISYLPQRYKI
ncbi:hypothetical protein TWF225_005135 [Orbilia oligospora]|uniref:Uncharacterized protein n=1 Tax=Orbilia oligospora TaxID=2813651 RepID=A0A8H2E964_ORBOL|nr:hypothetical protein TWF225_005135 [Orbilia oligospora]KAF3241525.1 hypothetical protein TWF128_011012 [Orbilia oligospora]KAF3249319.1 hypothetical protein TWF217_008916 [Orbilia oligospora]KAF3296394.1 hypothetical protein TWF132_010988 [Orbilia oligospora]TGJ73018.1 hypothetical protein EYR41_000137 [Orbilia oligospora]